MEKKVQLPAGVSQVEVVGSMLDSMPNKVLKHVCSVMAAGFGTMDAKSFGNMIAGRGPLGILLDVLNSGDLQYSVTLKSKKGGEEAVIDNDSVVDTSEVPVYPPGVAELAALIERIKVGAKESAKSPESADAKKEGGPALDEVAKKIADSDSGGMIGDIPNVVLRKVVADLCAILSGISTGELTKPPPATAGQILAVAMTKVVEGMGGKAMHVVVEGKDGNPPTAEQIEAALSGALMDMAADAPAASTKH